MNAAGKKLEAVLNLGYNCMKKHKCLQCNVYKFLMLSFVEALLFTLLSKCLEGEADHGTGYHHHSRILSRMCYSTFNRLYG